MAYITGLMLIDAPASALNNGRGEDTKGVVKKIRTLSGEYPYVSAQSFRFWLRTTLESLFSNEWNASPVYTSGKGKNQQAYTKGDPIEHPDDDLFGYMRATSDETVTRVSPFRVSTVVSIAPVTIVDDFGVMARRGQQPEGEEAREGSVLHSHEFYRTTLQALFSLNLSATGTFSTEPRTGYQNLGKETLAIAKNQLEVVNQKNYRLPINERIRRNRMLLQGLARIEGGAKQSLHYTDVSSAFTIMAVTTGGNHIFGHLVHADNKRHPAIHEQALNQIADTFSNDILSPLYVGRVEGFMDSAREVFANRNIPVVHPRQAFDQLADDLAKNPQWLD